MDKHQHDNLRRCLAYMAGTDEERRQHVQAERDRIAKMLRAAKIRVKANKAANGGIYVA